MSQHTQTNIVEPTVAVTQEGSDQPGKQPGRESQATKVVVEILLVLLAIVSCLRLFLGDFAALLEDIEKLFF